MKIVAQTPDFFTDLDATAISAFVGLRLLQYQEGLKSEQNDIICAAGLEPGQLIASAVSSGSQHFLQKNKDYFFEDVVTTAHLLMDPEKYFQQKSESLLLSCKKNIEIPVVGHEDKEKVRAQIQDFIKDVANSSLSESLNTIFEELFMNATLDAPREYAKNNGSTITKTLPVKFHLCYSADRLAISCEDGYGSLSIAKFINRMNEVYQKGAGEVINLHRPGGAGLGCVLMFEQCASLYLGVKKSKTTLVSCVLPLKLNFRQKAAIKKSLHLIEI